ncbi:MAG: Regulatory protein MsrR [Firmicutes bacterium ADurb.Bin373]|nr:MAG: Regulatory protein MsrR [Firmicutes bacterium ADurb.Bin373]
MNKPKRRLKRKAPFIICILLLIALFAAGYYEVNKILNPNIEDMSGITTPAPGKRTNVLLLGVDARDGESMARTDSIIMASIDPRSKQIALLSIPRDTRVKIPGHGWDKVNSASVYGGPEMTTKVVSDLLGVPLKYYVLTDFGGFKDIVDILGGVTIDVEQDMYHLDDPGYTINLKEGLQRLDGDKAIQYVRYRGYVEADIERTRHQQTFLMALAKEILQPATIPKLPKLAPEINKYVKTNLGVSDMVKLASTLRSIDDYSMVAQTLPGRNIDIAEGSYWGVDPAEARQMVAKLFNGEVTTDIVLNTPLTGQYAPPPERIIEEVEEQADDIKQQGESDDEKSPIKPARPDATRPDTDGGADSPDSEDGSETSDSPEYRPGDNTLPDPADSPETPDSPGTQVIITPADDYDDLKQGDGPFVSP